MPPAARVTDDHTCPMTSPIPHKGGPIIPPCEPTVIVGDQPQARIFDQAKCIPTLDFIAKGCSSVLVGFLPAARKGDPTIHGGIITGGEATVLIGDDAGGCPCAKKAAKSGNPVVRTSVKGKVLPSQPEPTPPPKEDPTKRKKRLEQVYKDAQADYDNAAVLNNPLQQAGMYLESMASLGRSGLKTGLVKTGELIAASKGVKLPPGSGLAAGLALNCMLNLFPKNVNALTGRKAEDPGSSGSKLDTAQKLFKAAMNKDAGAAKQALADFARSEGQDALVNKVIEQVAKKALPIP